MNASVSHYLHQLKLCAGSQTSSTAKKLHAQIIKAALHLCPPLPNTLLGVYGKCGLVGDALHLFDEMPHRDHVSWASLLTAHNQASLPHRTLSMFRFMYESDSLLPDHFVFASVVKACSSLGAIRQGKQVHARFMLSQFCEDDVVKSSLVDMYAKCGLPDNARAVFDSISKRSVVSWTALISGYARSGRKLDALEMFEKLPVKSLFSWTALISGLVQSGNGVDALYLFIEMRREGVDIVDPLVLSSTVGACANLAVLELGKQVHGLVIGLGYGSCLFISNTLVDMYAKCSDILAAKYIFGGMQQKDVVSWTSIIVGVAQHGRAEEALTLYDGMVGAGIKPNEVTFVGLIYACSHVGFVSKGRAIFRSMIEDYGIRPCLQHYTCFLDLLSRSGHLSEAWNVINSMPFEPDEPTWAALLSACKQHGDTQMGIRVADHLLSLNPEDPSSYILLSNVYAGAGMWENVAKVRKLMTAREVKKNPGYSSIDIGKESQVFYAGETSHPLKDEIFDLLKELDAEMRKRGYVPDSSFVLHDMEQQEKEKLLFWHSERLALAYGLLKAVPGTPIRIVKNLRVCGDCHTVLKFISSIVKRDIIVRDATRYHHFSKGECSCNDFW
ncbi:putative tetratricopeptide-like helical domain, DYW domain-containing protein [Rosa chinensis]|uniref:Putative tetratricopeptide-like helical domain, DYW domain-containing protein n=1 Tax=Rosa chinensis TaxID=74649 RepID=A0A2P6QW16_ROSCH|nr:pentatricopeptide repeat-containing protein At4g14050, mitochondrial [Rosa chinensis]XP_024192582.1 pentatricopeptide repeat-containing protein At4g14050, mitochondrial [Rosa chinensis]XP_024192583.1 pentatricopeptide repeat-containing protein At4g14050, mitochondrial [Rosa chinensis]XP_040375294.1 pentatricopeptide repeat-containing protein At4g14050, mitochondrial [Rosa chinensis]XP_040375295.1 pentatricopeptide repeat-containing protein At4g14050, mitochondrial [Rosa chinensis]PRQ38377.1